MVVFKGPLTVTLSFMKRENDERGSQIAYNEFRNKIIIGLPDIACIVLNTCSFSFFNPASNYLALSLRLLHMIQFSPTRPTPTKITIP